MANLATLVDYEKEYPINIVNHVTGEPLGITINVVSKDSRRVVNALRDWQARKFDEAARSDKREETSADRLKFIEEHGTETLIASISSWDWGEHSFEHINGSGVPSEDDKRFLVGHPNAGWILTQIAEGAHKIENFMQESPRRAQRGSKKT